MPGATAGSAGGVSLVGTVLRVGQPDLVAADYPASVASRRPRLPVILALLDLVGLLASGVAVAGFNTANVNGFSVASDRIFPGQRTTSAWSMIDSGDGSVGDVSSSTSFAEGTTYTTGNWSSSFSGTRYFEVVYAAPLPGGISTSSVTFNFDFAANNAADTACYYIEVYREAAGTLIGTHGSSGSPVACVTGTTPSHTSVALSEVTTSDQADDLRVRVYAKDSGNRALLIDLATVTGSSYSTFTLYNLLVRDRSTGTQTTAAGGIVTAGDGLVLTSTSWSTAFAAGRDFSLSLPDWVPTSATLSAVDFQLKYRSGTNGANACWYFEVYDYLNALIGTHGSSGSPISCNSSNSTFVTDTVSLPEINTAIEANSVLIKLYFKSSGSSTVVFDNALLRVTYALGTGSGCASPGDQTIDAVADTYVDQANASNNFGNNTTASVQSRSGSRNRRLLITFPLPAVPTGCSVTAATLRVNASAASAARTLEAAQVSSSWSEKTVTWNTKPTTTGTAATTSNGTGYQSWSVTSLVQAMLSGANYGFQIKDQTEDAGGAGFAQTYRTTESLVSIPQLDITFG